MAQLVFTRRAVSLCLCGWDLPAAELGEEFENVSILAAIAVNEDGYREVLDAAEGMKEDKASWISFFQCLRGSGLDSVKLIAGDKCLGMLEAAGEVFPDAKYQRCAVHFYRNVFELIWLWQKGCAEQYVCKKGNRQISCRNLPIPLDGAVTLDVHKKLSFSIGSATAHGYYDVNGPFSINCSTRPVSLSLVIGRVPCPYFRRMV